MFGREMPFGPSPSYYREDTPRRWLPGPGDRFTVSPNKNIGDRSYITDLWSCIAINEGHVYAERVGATPGGWEAKPRVMVLTEHEFYCANDFVKSYAIAEDFGMTETGRIIP